MDKNLANLIAVMRQVTTEAPPPTGELISVDDTVSKAASVYETVRNTLEYDEEHRLRRNAIRRILKRRLGADEDLTEVAKELLHELIWARYLPNQTISESRIGDVEQVLKKYRQLFGRLDRVKDVDKTHEFLLDLVSSEIEYLLIPPTEEDGMAGFAYNVFRERIKWQSQAVATKDRDLQLYLAVHRALLRSNLSTLRYKVLILFYPEWPKADAELITEVADNLQKVMDHIDAQVLHPAADSLHRLVRRYVIMFNVLRDVILKDPANAPKLIESDEFNRAVGSAAKKRYQAYRTRLKRSVLRAVAFLFVTKMLLALVIELPYDLVILQTTNFIPLITNVIFFPILLGVIGLTVFIPEKKNTEMIRKYLRAILFNKEELVVTFRGKRAWGRSKAGLIFNYLYLAMFLVSYGLVAYFLHTIDFNVLSIAIFLFFLSLVMFFGIRIRMSKRDLVILQRSGGLLSTLFDFFFLPIIRAGRWMALRAPRINVFLFFLDYIVEAPFKMAIQMIEGWIAFMREKKEEIE
ncbi:MAG: hypothetical protein ABIG32_03840 [Candidatus Uhrbacteria bacterium]|nr:hypothetical protein [Patescibacteria group bacterium]MBU1907041.1 hypothetical protein [Patescibacteria group bacterium]